MPLLGNIPTTVGRTRPRQAPLHDQHGYGEVQARGMGTDPIVDEPSHRAPIGPRRVRNPEPEGPLGDLVNEALRKKLEPHGAKMRQVAEDMGWRTPDLNEWEQERQRQKLRKLAEAEFDPQAETDPNWGADDDWVPDDWNEWESDFNKPMLAGRLREHMGAHSSVPVTSRTGHELTEPGLESLHRGMHWNKSQGYARKDAYDDGRQGGEWHKHENELKNGEDWRTGENVIDERGQQVAWMQGRPQWDWERGATDVARPQGDVRHGQGLYDEEGSLDPLHNVPLDDVMPDVRRLVREYGDTQGAAEALADRHGGSVPSWRKTLERLQGGGQRNVSPGVADKLGVTQSSAHRPGLMDSITYDTANREGGWYTPTRMHNYDSAPAQSNGSGFMDFGGNWLSDINQFNPVHWAAAGLQGVQPDVDPMRMGGAGGTAGLMSLLSNPAFIMGAL